jgi:hypothetical protein
MDKNWLLRIYTRACRETLLRAECTWTPPTDKTINTCRDMYCIEHLHGMYASEHREFLCVEQEIATRQAHHSGLREREIEVDLSIQ